MRWLLDTPYMPLIAWTVLIAILVQVYKSLTKSFELRHHPIVERTLPLIPLVLGALTGFAFPETLGLPEIVNGDSVPRMLGALYGIGAGFASSGVFQAVRTALPEPIARKLTVSEEKKEGN